MSGYRSTCSIPGCTSLATRVVRVVLVSSCVVIAKRPVCNSDKCENIAINSVRVRTETVSV
jgi:hypothetical protein